MKVKNNFKKSLKESTPCVCVWSHERDAAKKGEEVSKERLRENPSRKTQNENTGQCVSL